MNKPKIIFSNFLQFTSIIDVKLSGTLSPQWDGSYNKFKKIRQPSYSSDWVSATSPKLKLENQAFEKNEELWHSIKNGNELFYVLRSNFFDVLYVGVTSKGLERGLLGNGGRLHHHIRKFLAIKGASTDHTAGWHHHGFQRYKHALRQNLSPQKLLDDILISFGVFQDETNVNASNFEGYVLSSAFCALAGGENTRVLNSGALNYEPASINFSHWL
jgi:hypothetical protein